MGLIQDRLSTLYLGSCRSRAALTYAEAQSRIDDDRLQDEVSVNLRRMNGIARVLRQQRAEHGALQLASPEVKFEIDTETHDPLDVGMYQVHSHLHASYNNCSPRTWQAN